ncbi:hypothetical protein [Neobacillus mesonae]|uniref:hypothetical protein n=1 Tax=Neobacillus mesonae TaxID=1193713 RepID=UPI00257482B7|nr:hypothetical protein [Neobacillus mesonae]
MNLFKSRVAGFWFGAFITMGAEALIAYVLYRFLIQKGYVYTFRVAVNTQYLSYNLTLLFCTAVFTMVFWGVFRERDNEEVQTTVQYLLSHVKHPITAGSLLLFLFTFFLL